MWSDNVLIPINPIIIIIIISQILISVHKVLYSESNKDVNIGDLKYIKLKPAWRVHDFISKTHLYINE